MLIISAGLAAACPESNGQIRSAAVWLSVGCADAPGAAGCLAVGAGSLTIRNSCAIVSIDTVSGKTTAEIINFQPESQ